MLIKNLEHDTRKCSKFSDKTKAVLLVHLYGLAGEATKIEEFCKNKNIYLIEESAEAHGQFVEGGHVVHLEIYQP